MSYENAALWAGAAIATVPVVVWLLGAFNDLYFGSKRNLPAGKMGWFLLGETSIFTKCFTTNMPDWFIDRLVKQYGKWPAYKSHLFGSPAIILTTPELNKFASTRMDLFENGWPSGEKLMGKHALTVSKGDKHKKLRTHFVTSIGGNKSISSALPKVEISTKAALARWADGKQFGFRDAVRKLTFEHIAELFLSFTEPEDVERLDLEYKSMLQGFRAFPLMIPGATFYKAVQSKKKLCKIIRDVMADRRAKNNGTQYDDILRYMMDSRDENGNPMNDEEIEDNVSSFFLAAHESTAVTIMWACIHLSKNPQYLKELKDEYDQAAAVKGGQYFTLHELAEFQFTRKVVDETLRITNVSPMIFRKATKDIELSNGVTVPKGWRAILWVRAQHLNPDYYENPLKFDPHRWDSENFAKVRPNFMAFGVGHRTCPGIGLARMKVSLFLYYLVSQYKWEFLNPNSPIIHLPHARPADGAQIIMTPL